MTPYHHRYTHTQISKQAFPSNSLKSNRQNYKQAITNMMSTTATKITQTAARMSQRKAFSGTRAAIDESFAFYPVTQRRVVVKQATQMEQQTPSNCLSYHPSTSVRATRTTKNIKSVDQPTLTTQAEDIVYWGEAA